MSLDRWSEHDSPSCRYCGRGIKSGWQCGPCESGEVVLTSETPDSRVGAPRPGCPREEFTPEQLAEYRATTAAFDAAQMAEAEVVPEEERELNDMPIIAKETGGNFKPAPAGVARGICVDVVDLGMVKTTYAGKPPTLKHKVRVVWQLADVDPAIGKRPLVDQRYTLSLHEKAALRKDLQSWRGRAFSAAELQGFDVEKVIGAPCMLNVVHSADGQYANISAIMPLPKGMVAPTTDGYVRVKDRPKDVPERAAGDDDHDGEPDGFVVTDEMVPF